MIALIAYRLGPHIVCVFVAEAQAINMLVFQQQMFDPFGNLFASVF